MSGFSQNDIGTYRYQDGGVTLTPNLEYIKRAMTEHHWTGSKLASKMGVSRMEVSRLLRGKRAGGKKCIGGLIKAFPQASINELFFLD